MPKSDPDHVLTPTILASSVSNVIFLRVQAGIDIDIDILYMHAMQMEEIQLLGQSSLSY